MAFVPHPRSLGYAVKQFVFSEVPTLIAVWTLRRGALDQFAGRERRARIGAAFLGGASYAFLLAALGS